MRATIFFLIIAIVAAFCSAKVARDQKCMLPVQTGRCYAYFPKYAYDADKNECTQFIYGGCGGNDNQFDFKEDCEKTCME